MRQRFETLDTFRGIVIINMIAYHFLYDVFVIFGSNSMWYRQPGAFAWQQFICCSFIILSGFVWPYGKQKNLKRGIIINLLGFVITAFTMIFTPGEIIWFGILNFLGCAILLMWLLDLVFCKQAKKTDVFVPGHLFGDHRSGALPMRFYWAGLIINLALFLLLRRVTSGIFGFQLLGQIDFTFGHIPDELYQHNFLIPFGFPTDSFRSSDFFPLTPWFFLYAFGYFLGRILERQEWFQNLAHGKIPVVNWMGRKSIWIYMVHQIICYGICLLIF